MTWADTWAVSAHIGHAGLGPFLESADVKRVIRKANIFEGRVVFYFRMNGSQAEFIADFWANK
jgi:hypothetical protein